MREIPYTLSSESGGHYNSVNYNLCRKTVPYSCLRPLPLTLPKTGKECMKKIISYAFAKFVKCSS